MKLKPKMLVAVLIVLIVLVQGAVTVFATTPYDNYVYDNLGEPLDSAIAAVPNKVIDKDYLQTSLKNPQDLFVAKDGKLYIADTGNNRILQLDKNYKVLNEIKTFENNGAEDTFSDPMGVFVDNNNHIFIADNANKRVVVLDQSFKLITLHGAPKSELLPKDFDYKPSKVVCDSAGRMFVTSLGFNMGVIEFDREGQFVQLLGAAKVTYSIKDMIWRMLSTKAQRDRMEAFVPAEYNNMFVDAEDFLYVSTGTFGNGSLDDFTPIRRLNAKGDDVLRREYKVVGDMKISTSGAIKGPSYVVDVVTLDNGVYAMLDQKRGRVFVYNSDGILLFNFGGLGKTAGTLDTPTSMAYVNDEFLILDAAKGVINTYSLTEYGELMLASQHYKNVDNYEKEQETWEKIYDLNSNHPLVNREMGKIAYKQRDMKSAMKYFKLAEEQEDYSRAFKFYRREVINKYFNIGALILVIGIISLFIFNKIKKHYRKTHPKQLKKNPFKYAFYAIFRPLDGFWDLKFEKRGSIKVAWTMIGLTVLAFVLQSQFTGFIFNMKRPEDVNVIADIAAVVLPIALWIISVSCVTSLRDGEGSIKDIIIATGYSLTPLVLVIPFATIFSNIITIEEGMLHTLFIVIGFIWAGALLVVSVKQTHNYTMGKAVSSIFISLAVILIIIFIALLGIALVQQMIAFVSDLNSELVNRL